MTLSAGTGFNALNREVFGFAQLINFNAKVSNTDRVAFDFVSPVQHYLVEMQPGIDTAGMAANDILSFQVTGNGLTIFQTKFALAAASEPVQNQLPLLKFILPPTTILKAIFNMQSGTGMVGTATCMFRGIQFG
jgi:hypothetical protein